MIDQSIINDMQVTCIYDTHMRNDIICKNPISYLL